MIDGLTKPGLQLGANVEQVLPMFTAFTPSSVEFGTASQEASVANVHGIYYVLHFESGWQPHRIGIDHGVKPNSQLGRQQLSMAFTTSYITNLAGKHTESGLTTE